MICKIFHDHRVAGTGWPGVRVLCLGEKASVVNRFFHDHRVLGLVGLVSGC